MSIFSQLMDWAKFDDDKVQGSEAWKQARQRRIGGSDIPVILGLSPYKTYDQLLDEYVGRREKEDISKKPHVLRGINAEPVARALLEEKYNVKYTTPVIEHPKHKHLVVSLDGYCESHIIEIKTMGVVNHEYASYGVIPDYYRAQCEWAMTLTGKPLLFASYRPEDGTLHDFFIETPTTERKRFLIACALKFYRKVEAIRLKGSSG